MRRAVPVFTALLLALSVGARAEPGRTEGGAGLERLRAAAARYPDDPDLAWALARLLSLSGRRAEAIAGLERSVTRWPDRADAALLLGSLLAEEGRAADALPHLQRAVVLDPASGAARYQLALVLQRLGRPDEALAQLRVAGEIEPELRGETLLLRGVTRLEHGDEQAGASLLREAIELDPDGETAYSARLALGEPPPAPDRAQLEAYAGAGYDSNVILDSGSVPGFSTDRDDGAGVWGAAFRVDPLLGERYGLTLGARFDERDYLDLDAYDERDYTGFFSVRLLAAPRAWLRLDGTYAHTRLDDAEYLSRGSLRPQLTAILGERSGAVRVVGEVEELRYADTPLFSSLERDGIAFGAGLEHHVPIPGWRDAWGSLRFDYRRLETDAKKDPLGFRGAYDHDRYRGGLEARLLGPFEIETTLGVSISGEIYRHHDLLDFLITDRVRRRRDLALETQLELVRPLTSVVDVALSYRFSDRRSNAAVYAYDRHVAGLQLRVHAF